MMMWRKFSSLSAPIKTAFPVQTIGLWSSYIYTYSTSANTLDSNTAESPKTGRQFSISLPMWIPVVLDVMLTRYNALWWTVVCVWKQNPLISYIVHHHQHHTHLHIQCGTITIYVTSRNNYKFAAHRMQPSQRLIECFGEYIISLLFRWRRRTEEQHHSTLSVDVVVVLLVVLCGPFVSWVSDL